MPSEYAAMRCRAKRERDFFFLESNKKIVKLHLFRSSYRSVCIISLWVNMRFPSFLAVKYVFC